MKPAFTVVAATLAGCALGLMHSGGEAGQALRQNLADLLSPAAQAAADSPEQQNFVPVTFVSGNPQSVLDGFQVDGKPDPTFGNCMRDVGALEFKGMVEIATNHEHRITTSLVNCVLTQNRQRFCNGKPRQQVAAAMELYLWSRDYNFNNRADLDKRFEMAHAKEPFVSHADLDPYYKTWDGPEDRAVYNNLKALARGGYINPKIFALLPRYEINQAMQDVKVEYAGCPKPDAQGS